MKALHARSGPRHLAYAARQFAHHRRPAAYALWHLTNPLLWVPFAILQGFTFFNMTTLLHEVVHSSVFDKRRPAGTARSASSTRSTSGISASQFTRWHLDHHDNLGSSEDDPKRHWLSPKRNARWYKLLYCTPALIPIYFRAGGERGALVPGGAAPHDRARAAGDDRRSSSGSAAALCVSAAGGVLARVWAVPYFLVFPVAFTLNRLGQHYDIDPTHPLKWSTVMAPSRLWDFLFVYSNYHVEHHYFPSVPVLQPPRAAPAAAPALRPARPEAATPIARSSGSGSCGTARPTRTGTRRATRTVPSRPAPRRSRRPAQGRLFAVPRPARPSRGAPSRAGGRQVRFDVEDGRPVEHVHAAHAQSGPSRPRSSTTERPIGLGRRGERDAKTP